MSASRQCDFEQCALQGRGSYGTVHSGRRKQDDQIYVIKLIPLSGLSAGEQERCAEEVKLMARLESEFIVRYYDSFVDGDQNWMNRHTCNSTNNSKCGKHGISSLCIVMEYCNDGDQNQEIECRRTALVKETMLSNEPLKIIPGLLEDRVWVLFIQLCIGLFALHEQRVLHRDIKPANIFLSNKHVRLGDLGVARAVNTVGFANTVIGTPYYLAPELVEGRAYSYKADVWSLGVLLYEMLTLKHPFEASNQAALLLKIVQGKFKSTSKLYTAPLRALTKLLLRKAPQQRPSIAQILNLQIVKKKALQQNITQPLIKTEDKNITLQKPSASSNNSNLEKQQIMEAVEPILQHNNDFGIIGTRVNSSSHNNSHNSHNRPSSQQGNHQHVLNHNSHNNNNKMNNGHSKVSNNNNNNNNKVNNGRPNSSNLKKVKYVYTPSALLHQDFLVRGNDVPEIEEMEEEEEEEEETIHEMLPSGENAAGMTMAYMASIPNVYKEQKKNAILSNSPSDNNNNHNVIGNYLVKPKKAGSGNTPEMNNPTNTPPVPSRIISRKQIIQPASVHDRLHNNNNNNLHTNTSTIRRDAKDAYKQAMKALDIVEECNKEKIKLPLRIRTSKNFPVAHNKDSPIVNNAPIVNNTPIVNNAPIVNNTPVIMVKPNRHEIAANNRKKLETGWSGISGVSNNSANLHSHHHNKVLKGQRLKGPSLYHSSHNSPVETKIQLEVGKGMLQRNDTNENNRRAQSRMKSKGLQGKYLIAEQAPTSNVHIPDISLDIIGGGIVHNNNNNNVNVHKVKKVAQRKVNICEEENKQYSHDFIAESCSSPTSPAVSEEGSIEILEEHDDQDGNTSEEANDHTNTTTPTSNMVKLCVTSDFRDVFVPPSQPLDAYPPTQDEDIDEDIDALLNEQYNYDEEDEEDAEQLEQSDMDMPVPVPAKGYSLSQSHLPPYLRQMAHNVGYATTMERNQIN